MADQEESSQRALSLSPPPPPPSPALFEEEVSSRRAPPLSPSAPPPPSPAIFEEEESNQCPPGCPPPMSPPPPPPPSPAIFEGSSSEAIPWVDTDDSSSSTPNTDLLSLWLSNYRAAPQPKAEEEPLEDVPTLQNFDLESPFPNLVDWNTTSTTVTQAPVVTQLLWMQLHTPIGGEVDDVSGLALRSQSPKSSILPLALSPPALGIQSSISPLVGGIQFPQASISPPSSPLARRIQFPQTSIGTQSASFSSLLSTITPPVGNALTSPSPVPVPERRSWSRVILSTPPPPAAWRHLFLPHSAFSSLSVPSSHPSHQTHHFLSAASTGHNQQEVPAAHVPAAFSTRNANADADSFPGFVPASPPSWSQVMASWESWIPNQPLISNGQDMKLLIPQRPQFLLPPVAATTPEPPQMLANCVGNMPNSNAGEDVPVEGPPQAQAGESSRRRRKRSKLAARTDKKLFK